MIWFVHNPSDGVEVSALAIRGRAAEAVTAPRAHLFDRDGDGNYSTKGTLKTLEVLEEKLKDGDTLLDCRNRVPHTQVRWAEGREIYWSPSLGG